MGRGLFICSGLGGQTPGAPFSAPSNPPTIAQIGLKQSLVKRVGGRETFLCLFRRTTFLTRLQNSLFFEMKCLQQMHRPATTIFLLNQMPSANKPTINNYNIKTFTK